MDEEITLPSLISSLNTIERGGGVFSKSSSSSRKSVTKINPHELSRTVTLNPQSAANEDSARRTTPLSKTVLPTGGSKQQKGVNTYKLLSDQAQREGLRASSVSAPSTVSYSKTCSESGSRDLNDVDVPSHIKQFMRDWEEVHANRLRLPLLKQLSPRSRKKASLLPPPNDLDNAKLHAYESIGPDKQLYSKLGQQAIREQMRQLRLGESRRMETNPKLKSMNVTTELPRQRNEFAIESRPPEVSYSSTAYFDDVRDRQQRREKQRDRVSLFTREGDDDSESLSGPVTRPQSPGISSYPFQTDLTALLDGRPLSPLQKESLQTRQHQYHSLSYEEEEENASVSSVASSEAAAAAVAWRQQENVGKPGKGNSGSPLRQVYAPVLQEATAAASDALVAFESTAMEYDQQMARRHAKRRQDKAFMDQWRSRLLDEIGLNIDPTFSAKLKFGKAVSMVIYYMYMLKVRVAVDTWREYAARVGVHRRRKAGELMVRVGRGMLARREAREVRLNLQRQREAEEEYERQRMAFRNFNARRIVRTWRRFKKWQKRVLKEKRRAAAVAIQKRARGMLARSYVAWLRDYQRRARISGTKIQSVWWMYKAKRRVTLLRKLEYVRQWELSKAEKLMLKRMEYRHHGAAITVSRAYRAHTIHSRLQSLLYWNRMKHACNIQRVYRGHVVRKEYRRLSLARARRAAERDRAATTIQAQVRMRMAMRAYFGRMSGKREERERRRKKKKKKLKDKVIKLGESKFNISRVNRRIRKSLRNMMPFRYVFERVRARTIQRYYRGYRTRKRTLVMLVHMRVRRVYEKRERREKSAILIQKVFRGHRRRHTMRKELWRRMAIVIQCYWRRRAARRLVQAMIQKNCAMDILNRTLSAIVLGMRARKTVLLERMYRKHVTKIQRLGRKYLGRMFLRERKDLLRLRDDGNASAALTTLRVMSAVELMILKETMAREIGYRPRVLCGYHCPCYGPPQALFVSALGKKGRTDPELLTSNRIDSSNAQKLIAKLDAVYAVERKDKKTPQKEEKVKKGSASTNLMILNAIKIGIVDMPKVDRKVSPTEIDIFFNKFRGTAGGNVLIFSEFSAFLKGLGEFCLQILPGGVDGLKTEDEGSSHSTPVVGRAHPVIRRTTTISSHGDLDGSLKRQESSDALMKAGSPPTTPDGRVRSSLRGKKEKSTIRTAIAKYLLPTENLTKNSGCTGLAMLLMLFMASETEPWMEGVVAWMHSEAYARVSAIIVPMQQLVRRKLARVHVMRRKIEKSQADAVLRVHSAVSSLQRLVRSYLHWQMAVKIAQVTIVKYIPHKGEPYWHNPKTRVSTYTKPKILGKYDCLEIPLPAPKLEFVVMCGNCEEVPAEVNCLECEDSMCRNCFSTFHCKGKKTKHSYAIIQKCSLCQFQMATKSCMTCSLRKPKRRSVMELIKGDRGLLCDSCYIHLHENTISSETGGKKNTTAALRDGTREAYLVGQALNQRLDTDHRYASLVQVCEECQWRAASYRCADCDQIYCNKCLIGFHSIGGPFSKHKAEKLPYYTPDMHKKFERAMFEQRLQKRIEKVAQAYARKAMERKIRSAIKIQSWWRMIVGGCQGRAHMKEKRLKIRKMARLRKYEDFKYRKTFLYRIRNVFGFTPQLASDTLEERVLGRHNIFIRQRLREYVWRNCDDWGYLHKYSKMQPDTPVIPQSRKGVPRTGFAVGTPAELADQVKRGGFRLPGRLFMKQGEKEHEINMDMTSFLRRGMYIRIQQCFFVVTKVESDKVSFNRRWRFKDRRNSLMYLVPCYPGEPYKWYYKGKLLLFDYVTGNVVTQTILQGYLMYYQYLTERAKKKATSSKRLGFMIGAKKWSKRAELYALKTAWAKNLLMEDAGVSDMASVDTGGKAGKSGPKSGGTGLIKKWKNPEDRIPGELWEATDEEKENRRARERKMTRDELAAEAGEWEERFDALKNKPYYVHLATNEATYEVPKSVDAKREIEVEAEAKRKEFAETQRKIARMAKEKSAKKKKGRK